MRRAINWLMFLALVGGAAFVANMAIRPEPVAVEVAGVECGSMQVTIDVEGRTRVRDRFVISAPVTGKLSRIALKEGDRLNTGDIVAHLTPIPSDRRTIRASEAAVRVAQAQKQGAGAALERAEAGRRQARRDRERVETLAANGIASPHELEQARLADANAQKTHEAAVAATEAAAFEVEAAQAALFAADPDQASKDGTAQIPVRSPIGGRVLHVRETSERVVNAGDPLVELADAEALELVFETLSSDAVKIATGAPILVEQWGGEDVLHGVVRTIEPSAFTKVSALGVEEQRVNVIGNLNHGRGILGDGYRVEGRIIVWREDNVLMVPVSALFRKDDSWSVFVVSGGIARSRPIRIGHRNDSEAEVLAGLAEDETVILYPSDRIADGVSIVASRRAQ